MSHKLLAILLLLPVYGCQQSNEPDPAAPVESAFMNPDVRPQDDFYEYVNGTWLSETEIPEDKSNYGSFDLVADETEENLRLLIEEVSADDSAAPGSAAQKIRDFYNAYLDAEAANQLGIEAISSELEAIEQAQSHEDVLRLFAELSTHGVNTPFLADIAPDLNDATRYAVYLEEAGLTLPDRDYYLVDNEQYVKGRDLYQQYVADLLALAGMNAGDDLAGDLLALETRLAEHHWTREDNRDPAKLNNPRTPDELQQMSPLVDWQAFLEAQQIPGRNEYIVLQPGYLEAVDDIFTGTPVDTWKNYLKFQTLDAFAPVLSDESFDLWFGFERAGLQGVPQPRPRWKRAVQSMDQNMGFLLGQLYVEKHFSAEAKERMVQMVDNLKQAYRDSITELEWMSEETRVAALEKLSRFLTQIAYPDKWRDYSKLEVTSEGLVSNIKKANEFEAQRQLNLLDEAVDRADWSMLPQTVNAGYNPLRNRITFPAAILQAPFFNVDGDEAANYGAIGAAIGHEIGHGFDDQGRKFDGDGTVRDWWTEEDAERFELRRQKLAGQYNSVEVIDGLTINGDFTSGENIGDLGGLSIAHEAYRLSLNGSEPPVIDGLTGDQRFFMGWAQVWRRLYRDEELKRRLTIDPHSPAKARTNVVVSNIPAFYEAFDVQPGDGMYLDPEARVKIW
jgi:endothelin-converting enzyme/putative endopeptidase